MRNLVEKERTAQKLADMGATFEQVVRAGSLLVTGDAADRRALDEAADSLGINREDLIETLLDVYAVAATSGVKRL